MIQDKSKVKTISENTIRSGKGNGIRVVSLKCDLTITGNTLSKCSGDLISLSPTTSYQVTVTDNKLTGKSKKTNGIYASNADISISGNTIKSTKAPIYLASSTIGTVGVNSYASNSKNTATIHAKQYKNLAKTSSVSLKKSGSTGMKVSWKKVSGASGYLVYRSTSQNGTYTKCASLSGASKTSYTDKKLKSGKTYYYKVVAYTTTSNGKVTISGSDSKVVSKKL